MNTSLRNGCFGKMDDFPVHTAPKQMFFQNLFFKSSLRHYCIKVRPPNSDLCLLFCVNPYSMLCAFWPALMLWRILNLNASQEAMQICFSSFCWLKSLFWVMLGKLWNHSAIVQAKAILQRSKLAQKYCDTVTLKQLISYLKDIGLF